MYILNVEYRRKPDLWSFLPKIVFGFVATCLRIFFRLSISKYCCFLPGPIGHYQYQSIKYHEVWLAEKILPNWCLCYRIDVMRPWLEYMILEPCYASLLTGAMEGLQVNFSKKHVRIWGRRHDIKPCLIFLNYSALVVASVTGNWSHTTENKPKTIVV